MSFSHLYNISKQGQYGKGEYEDEEADMGAYGDDVGGYKTGSSYANSKYNDDDYSPKKSNPSPVKDDPFNWDNPKPSSQKFDYNSKPKGVEKNYEEEMEDTGYDGWNDVKKGSMSVKQNIPDPYAKQTSVKASKYDPYPEDDFDFSRDKHGSDADRRAKAATIVNKSKTFFEDDNKQKQFDFGKNDQPKTFDFNEFGEVLEGK